MVFFYPLLYSSTSRFDHLKREESPMCVEEENHQCVLRYRSARRLDPARGVAFVTPSLRQSKTTTRPQQQTTTAACGTDSIYNIYIYIYISICF